MPEESSKKAAKHAKKERDAAIAAAQESDSRRRSIRIRPSEENISQSRLAPPQPQSNPTPSQTKDNGKGKEGTGQTASKFENKAIKDIIFDEYGKPVGPAVKISRLGVLVRQHLPISYHTWHQVPEIMKENVWNLLKQNYPNEQMDKKEMRNTMANIWRDVRSDYSINVTKLLEELENTKSVGEVDAILVKIGNLRPWFCRRATWDDFVKFRTPEEWKAFIEKFQGIRASFDLVHSSTRPRLRRRLTFPLMHTSMQRKVELMFNYNNTSFMVVVGQLMSVDPNEHVHSVPIEEGNGKVLIEVVIIPGIRLFRETPDAKCTDEAVSSTVAWPLNAIRDI